jgi:hypothetical protein
MVNYQNWLCTSRKNEIEFKDLSKGDYIKCNVDNYKSLIKVIYTGRECSCYKSRYKEGSGAVHLL